MISVFVIIALIFSVIIHEISHGFVAEKLGDPTARMAGRLTLNPISHIDLFGTILLPLMLSLSHLPVLGWAKPVPYNPNNLTRDMKYGPLKVAIAGPLSNLLILVVLGSLARFGFNFLSEGAILLLGLIAFLNTFLAVFNLVPIPPLDGSKALPHIIPGLSTEQVERVGFFGIILVFFVIYSFSGQLLRFAFSIFSFVTGPGVADLVRPLLFS